MGGWGRIGEWSGLGREGGGWGYLIYKEVMVGTILLVVFVSANETRLAKVTH